MSGASRAETLRAGWETIARLTARWRSSLLLPLFGVALAGALQGAAAAWRARGQAHGPTPIKVDEKITVSADPKSVWAIVGHFGALDWHPDVAGVKATGGDAIGAAREITLRKGGVVTESLDEYDPQQMKLAYRMSEPNLDALPISSYSATLAVRPAAAARCNGMAASIAATPAMSRRTISTTTPRARR